MDTILNVILFIAGLAIFDVAMSALYRFASMNVSYEFGRSISKFNRDLYDDDLTKEFDDHRKINN